MEVIAIIIVLLAPLAAIFGLVNIVHPLKALKITHRRQGAYIVGGSIILFFGGGLLGAASQPGGLKVSPDDTATGKPSAVAQLPITPPSPPAGLTQTEFNTVWAETKTAMSGCDASVAAAGRVMGEGDVYAAYPAVQKAKEVCERANSAVRDVTIPRSAKGDVKKALNEARDGCSLAMFVKGQAMDKVLKVVNGDNRPSAVSEARSEMETATSYTLRCAIGYMAAAEKAHLTLPDVEAAKSSS